MLAFPRHGESVAVGRGFQIINLQFAEKLNLSVLLGVASVRRLKLRKSHVSQLEAGAVKPERMCVDGRWRGEGVVSRGIGVLGRRNKVGFFMNVNSPEDEQSILFETSRPDRLFSEATLHPKAMLLLIFKNMQHFKHHLIRIEFIGYCM